MSNTIQFPYFLNALPEIAEKRWSHADFTEHRFAAPESARQSPSAFIEHIQQLTRDDIKVPYLKDLQGMPSTVPSHIIQQIKLFP